MGDARPFLCEPPGPAETITGKGDILLFPFVEGKVECPLFPLFLLQGADPEHDVQDVTFENVSILGAKLTQGSSQLKLGENAAGIRFPTEAR